MCALLAFITTDYLIIHTMQISNRSILIHPLSGPVTPKDIDKPSNQDYMYMYYASIMVTQHSTKVDSSVRQIWKWPMSCNTDQSYTENIHQHLKYSSTHKVPAIIIFCIFFLLFFPHHICFCVEVTDDYWSI